MGLKAYYEMLIQTRPETEDANRIVIYAHIITVVITDIRYNTIITILANYTLRRRHLIVSTRIGLAITNQNTGVNLILKCNNSSSARNQLNCKSRNRME